MGAQDSTSQDSTSQDGTETAHVRRRHSGRRCRGVSGVAIRALIELLDESASADGMVGMEMVRRIANAVLSAEGPLAEYYANWEGGCDASFALRGIEQKRTDFIGRILTHSFAHLLDIPDSGIERKHLPQFFAAVRLIVGDEPYEKLRTRAGEAAGRHRDEDGMILWDAFYADPDVGAIFESVVVSIARSFRRFEPRKDWFLIVMNSSPSSISTASNAFIPKKPGDKAQREFGEAQMAHLFLALFAKYRMDTFTPERKAAFVETWGAEPEKVFGPLLVSLVGMAPPSH